MGSSTGNSRGRNKGGSPSTKDTPSTTGIPSPQSQSKRRTDSDCENGYETYPDETQRGIPTLQTHGLETHRGISGLQTHDLETRPGILDLQTRGGIPGPQNRELTNPLWNLGPAKP
jgi:hypothetical protein